VRDKTRYRYMSAFYFCLLVFQNISRAFQLNGINGCFFAVPQYCTTVWERSAGKIGNQLNDSRFSKLFELISFCLR